MWRMKRLVTINILLKFRLGKVTKLYNHKFRWVWYLFLKLLLIFMFSEESRKSSFRVTGKWRREECWIFSRPRLIFTRKFTIFKNLILGIFQNLLGSYIPSMPTQHHQKRLIINLPEFIYKISFKSLFNHP